MSKVDLLEQDIFDKSPSLLEILLSDKTTNGFLRWGTNDYAVLGSEYAEDKEIRPELVIGLNTRLIQPRAVKSAEEQQRRTRDRAEVFTPLWVCNAQNNFVDEAWFEAPSPFNTPQGLSWVTNPEPIAFTEKKPWMEYVVKNVLEVTCGEAPYLVSRYDPLTGEKLPVSQRIGLLDRKLRVVSENTSTEDDWCAWATRAYQATYGFDYQGDNVLLARENLLASYDEHFYDKFEHGLPPAALEQIAEIIAWNIWQMDGMDCTAPYVYDQDVTPVYTQDDLFGFSEPQQYSLKLMPVYCRIFDWDSNQAVEYASLMKG